MEFCDTRCMVCPEPGQVAVNLAGYHQVCNTHVTSLFGQTCQRCMYCQSLVFPVIRQCSFCLKGRSTSECKVCLNDLCINCCQPRCKFCELMEKICSSCMLYSDDVRFYKCRHLICGLCDKKNAGRCDECVSDRRCAQCKRADKTICTRPCGQIECDICFFGCEECDKAIFKCCGGEGIESKKKWIQRKICDKCNRVDITQEAIKGVQNEEKKEIEIKAAEKVSENKNTGPFNFQKRGSCVGCGQIAVLQKRKCEHEWCENCIKNNCPLCQALTNQNEMKICLICNKKKILKHRKCKHLSCEECLTKKCVECHNETKRDLNRCFKCEKSFQKLKKKSCNHKFCNTCNKSPCPECLDSNFENFNIHSATDKENCILCNSFAILQARPCGHKSCLNCKTKQCVYCVDLNLEVYQTDKNNKLIEFCKLCNTKPAQCIRECKHKCCRDCLKFVCIECPNNILICQSCKNRNDELIEAVCEHKICNKCLNTVCKACFPVYPCSNCGEIKDCYILNCSCKYLCYNCSFLRDGENCYLHSPPLHRCSSHFPCKFTLHDKNIRRECDGKYFCLGCKLVIIKRSEGKNHKKCFKK